MHILFVTGEFPPMAGGVGAYTHALARALNDLQVRVTVLTSESARPTPPDSGITVIPEVLKWGPGQWKKVARVAEMSRADWIHVQYQTAAFGMNPSINLAPRQWRRVPRRTWRVAWTYHDLLPPYLFPKAGARLRRWVTQRPARTSDLTIVTNEGDRLQLVGRSPNLHSIPIGSNIQGVTLSAEQRAEVRKLYGYTNDAQLIAYFGFVNRSKGGLTLMRTLDLLLRTGEDVSLLMIGDPLGASDPSNRAYLDEVKALVTDLGLSERVKWTGPLRDGDVGAALNAVDVLVLPFDDGASLRRGTLMAGLANGCAIVTSTPSAPVPKLVDGRDLCFVPASNPEATAETVRLLLHDTTLAGRVRAGARAVSTEFSWKKIAERHLTLYEDGL